MGGFVFSPSMCHNQLNREIIMKIKIIAFATSLGLALLTFLPTAHAASYSYRATVFQPTSCLAGAAYSQMNLSEPSDMVTITGLWTGDNSVVINSARDLTDSIPESVYLPISNNIYNVYSGLQSWANGDIVIKMPNGQGGTLGTYIILRTDDYGVANNPQGNCVRAPLIPLFAVPTTCSSFDYSDWGLCTNGQQVRTIAASSPSGCTGGSSVLTQSCTPACTANDYSCAEWSACSANGQQTRTCTKASTCEGGVSMPAISQSCTYTAPACTSWTYSDWGTCSSAGQKIRTVTGSSPEDCIGGNPVLSQTCTPPQKYPKITSVSPNTIVTHGTEIEITGENFGDRASNNGKVLISGSAEEQVVVSWTDTRIRAKVNNISQFLDSEKTNLNSKGFTTTTIALKIKCKISCGNGIVADGVASDGTDYVIGPSPLIKIFKSVSPQSPPQITSISPSVITGQNNEIEIIGENFGTNNDERVTVRTTGNRDQLIMSWSDKKIRTRVKSDIFGELSLTVTAKNQSGNLVDSNHFPLRVLQGPPRITSITPNSIRPEGSTVEIYGENFGVTDINWNKGRVYDLEGQTHNVLYWEHDRIKVEINIKNWNKSTSATALYVKVKCLDNDCSNGVDGPYGKDYVSNTFPIKVDQPSCTIDTWSCSDWNECSGRGIQNRSCTKTFDCPSIVTPSPATAQACTPAQPKCNADVWTCGAWGACSLSGIQNRSCSKSFDCPDVQTAPPTSDQYCEAPNRPTPQVPPSGSDEILNQETIIKSTVKLLCPFDERRASQGSGTVIDPSGTILTNKHVIVGTLGCLVGFISDFSDDPYFGERHIADIVKVSPTQDVAILKIRNPNNRRMPSVEALRGSSNIRLGIKVTTYGYPARFGKGMTYTDGVFSGVEGGYLKTTAILEHGNSGGGAYLKDGTFIGIPSAVVKGELNALGYILSINTIKAWLGNTPVIAGGTNNNYSRVSVLEDIDLNNLGSLKLFIPPTDAKGDLVTPLVTQTPPPVVPATTAKQANNTKEKPKPKQVEKPQEESIVIESPSQSQNVTVQQPAPSSEKSQPQKISRMKRFFGWIRNIFKR